MAMSGKASKKSGLRRGEAQSGSPNKPCCLHWASQTGNSEMVVCFSEALTVVLIRFVAGKLQS